MARMGSSRVPGRRWGARGLHLVGKMEGRQEQEDGSLQQSLQRGSEGQRREREESAAAAAKRFQPGIFIARSASPTAQTVSEGAEP